MKSQLLFSALFLSVIILSCQSNNGNEQKFSPLSDTTSVTQLTGDSIKLVKSAAIRCKVNDVTAAIRTISALTHKLGGVTYDQNLQAAEMATNEIKLSADSSLVITTYAPQADILVRIPSAYAEEFLYGVEDLANFTSHTNLHVDDKSLQYLENALMQKNRLSALKEPFTEKRDTLSLLHTVAVKDEITKQQISNMQVDADAHYSQVAINLFQNAMVKKEIIANTAIYDFQLPFGKRLGDALQDGWQGFLTLILFIVNLWMFILLAIAGMVTYRYVYPKKGLAARL